MITRMLADMMTKPGLSPVFDSPADYGLKFEDVTFCAEDGVELSGWLIRGTSNKIIIQSHFGVQCSRSGYTPKGKGMMKMFPRDISFLAHVKHLVSAGYSVFMYDLRNHGNSGAGICSWVSWGSDEYKDVVAAVDYVSQHPEYQSSPIGLLSICMGVNSTAYAYSQSTTLRNNSQIKAMVAVQPLSYEVMMEAMKIPRGLAEKVNQYNIKRGGKDLNEGSRSHAGNITVPTLILQNENDPLTKIDFVKKYYEDLRVEKEMLWFKGEKKRLDAYDYFSRSPEPMIKFFNKYVI